VELSHGRFEAICRLVVPGAPPRARPAHVRPARWV